MRLQLKHSLAIAFVIVLTAMMVSCTQLSYYSQAIGGQWEIYRARQPINKVLEDNATPTTVRDKLQLIQQARQFAVTQLNLPDNGSYTRYADLGRPYVVWNVFAAPEFSLTPLTWCFPIAGCVSYRGYFSEANARAFADKLRAEGHDVYVGGVAAYSTLGWFEDPVLNTMLTWPDVSLAELIFHELAHQKVYISGDSAFNEAFATAVGEFGVTCWLREQADEATAQRYQRAEQYSKDFKALIQQAQTRLKAVYDTDLPTPEKARKKREAFDEIRADYVALKARWGGYSGYDRWFEHDLNNAKLSSVLTYESHVPAFRALLLAENGDLNAFYLAAETLGKKSAEMRKTALNELSKQQVSRQQIAESLSCDMPR